MRITLLAHTSWSVAMPEHAASYGEYLAGGGSDAAEISTFAGRVCYQAFDRPNPETAQARGYIRNIIDHEHFSVLEHGTATFVFGGVSRSLTHELIRHRHFSFSQLSQRYVDHGDLDTNDYVLPYDANASEAVIISQAFNTAIDAYVALWDSAIQRGLSRKEAAGLARSVLPECTPTQIVVSGNHRSWREFLVKRGSLHAEAEIRELALGVYERLNDLAPELYQDFHVDTTTVLGTRWLDNS